MVYRGFTADSRLSPFRFRRGMRKGSGHVKPLCKSDYTTIRWTRSSQKWMAFCAEVKRIFSLIKSYGFREAATKSTKALCTRRSAVNSG